jgi:hypothetical protein
MNIYCHIVWSMSQWVASDMLISLNPCTYDQRGMKCEPVRVLHVEVEFHAQGMACLNTGLKTRAPD